MIMGTIGWMGLGVLSGYIVSRLMKSRGEGYLAGLRAGRGRHGGS